MPKTLLLVDDEPNVLRALRRVFQQDNYQVYTAENGVDGLKLLAEQEVQVIISDQRMPNMSGAEFLTEVKNHYPNTIRIILSAYSDFDAIKDAINGGAIYKFINKPWDDEVLRQYVHEAFEINSREHEREQTLIHQLDYDQLTGLYNRSRFNHRVTEAIELAKKDQSTFAIISISLDRFGKLTNKFGEPVGDQILITMAERLKIWLKEDKNAARSGNEEFILLSEHISLPILEASLQNLLTEIKKPLSISNLDMYASASIGVSLYPSQGDSYEVLIKRANLACSNVKESSGDNYQFYNADLDKSSITERLSESDIHQALNQKQFIVYYQPILSIDTQEIKGAEALIRWQHPIHGLIPPDQFISLCEETGLIIPIGAWVLRTACEQLKRWHDQGHHELFIAVNLSARQLRDKELLGVIQEVLESTKIPAHCLELEITESVLMRDIGATIELLHKIVNLKIKLSMDDFGTGYSSFSYLKQLPIHSLKIDKSFVNEIATDRHSAAIVSTIIALAKVLDLSTIAEGVEHNEQLTILREKGCDFAQGYLFSKPVIEQIFTALLK